MKEIECITDAEESLNKRSQEGIRTSNHEPKVASAAVAEAGERTKLDYRCKNSCFIGPPKSWSIIIKFEYFQMSVRDVQKPKNNKKVYSEVHSLKRDDELAQSIKSDRENIEQLEREQNKLLHIHQRALHALERCQDMLVILGEDDPEEIDPEEIDPEEIDPEEIDEHKLEKIEHAREDLQLWRAAEAKIATDLSEIDARLKQLYLARVKSKPKRINYALKKVKSPPSGSD